MYLKSVTHQMYIFRWAQMNNQVKATKKTFLSQQSVFFDIKYNISQWLSMFIFNTINI